MVYWKFNDHQLFNYSSSHKNWKLQVSILMVWKFKRFQVIIEKPLVQNHANMNIKNCLTFATEILLLERAVSYVIIKDVPMENLATAMSHLMVHFPVSKVSDFQFLFHFHNFIHKLDHNLFLSPMHISSLFIVMAGSAMSIIVNMTTIGTVNQCFKISPFR